MVHLPNASLARAPRSRRGRRAALWEHPRAPRARRWLAYRGEGRARIRSGGAQRRCGRARLTQRRAARGAYARRRGGWGHWAAELLRERCAGRASARRMRRGADPRAGGGIRVYPPPPFRVVAEDARHHATACPSNVPGSPTSALASSPVHVHALDSFRASCSSADPCATARATQSACRKRNPCHGTAGLLGARSRL